ncbi:hypothetical protein G6F63_016658 [Rhizopus arrhizus]|nr:hypothetical protein G6F63_016658 [Rhizopus arrhizus]
MRPSARCTVVRVRAARVTAPCRSRSAESQRNDQRQRRRTAGVVRYRRPLRTSEYSTSAITIRFMAMMPVRPYIDSYFQLMPVRPRRAESRTIIGAITRCSGTRHW